MTQMDLTRIRTFAVLGHGGCGKTSLLSGLLFQTGVTSRLGKVDEGTTVTDFDDEEVNRKISLNVAVAHTDWAGGRLFVIDTPGFGDFLPEGLATTAIVDSGVLVICGVGGVQTNTIKAWTELHRHGRPRLVVVNKLDRENASFERSLGALRETLGSGFVALQVPIGAEADFTGIVDVVQMKAFRYRTDESGQYEEIPIPADLQDTVDQYRDQLIEAVAESDDSLLEKYLEGVALTPEEISSGLVTGVRSGRLYPVLAAAALRNIGVAHVFDAAYALLPDPTHRPPFAGRVPPGDENSAQVERAADPSAPFSAIVFKTMVDPYAGRISLVRVVSGTYSTDRPLLNSSKGSSERPSAIAYLNGKTQAPAERISAGELAAFFKLKETMTGDTLCAPDSPVVFERPKFPDPVISFAVEPKTKADEDKISVSCVRLTEEDPTLTVGRHPQTKQFLLSGVGQLHVEVAVEKLRRRYGVNVDLKPPKIPYRETISGDADVRYRHKKQTGGAGQFGEVAIRINAVPRGQGFQFQNEIVGGVIPGQYIPSVEKGITAALDKGPVAGFPVVDIEVHLYDGKSHPVDSKDIAFQIAGSMAFKEAVLKARPTLLEPIMLIQVTVPDDVMGDVMGDLNSRRGRVQGMDSERGRQIIRATVPQAELLRYASDLRSLTADRGYFEMKFSHYEEVPAQLATKVIEAAKAEQA